MKRYLRIFASATTVFGLSLIGAVATPIGVSMASASPAQGVTSSTTLDACGYFIGYQTPATTMTSGATTTQRGTWYGVFNNYGNGQVMSLGNVQGAFAETTSTYGTDNQDTQGTEVFTSNAGQIFQSFSYGPDVSGGFSVVVTATRDLSFLTSNTNGGCYTGAFPRP